MTTPEVRVLFEPFMERLRRVGADEIGLEIADDLLDWSGVVRLTWLAYAGWRLNGLFASLYAVYPEARIVDVHMSDAGYAPGQGPQHHVSVSFITGAPFLEMPTDDETDE